MLEYSTLTELEERKFVTMDLSIINKIIDKYSTIAIKELINNDDGKSDFIRGNIKALENLQRNLIALQSQIHKKFNPKKE